MVKYDENNLSAFTLPQLHYIELDSEIVAFHTPSNKLSAPKVTSKYRMAAKAITAGVQAPELVSSINKT